MNLKNFVLPAVLSVAAFSLVSCEGKMENIHMRAESAQDFQAQKNQVENYDNFAHFVGIADIEHTPSFLDLDAFKKVLSTPPSSFSPSASPDSHYDEIQQAVFSFVGSQYENMKASKVLNIQKLDASLLEKYAEPQTAENYISIPFLEVGKEVASDLSDVKTESGIDKDGRFSIHQTVKGIITPQVVKGTVYLMTYQVGPDSTQLQQALVSIPDREDPAKKLPLLMFAHGGDSGLNFREIATLLQANLSNHIVAAPVYPGEKLCPVTTQKVDSKNDFERNCSDHDGNVVKPLQPILGERSPLVGDVNSLLALQDAIWKLAKNDVPSFYEGGNNIINPTGSSSLIPFYNENDKEQGIKTLGFADSRGGATLMAAIGRDGIISAGSSGTDTYHIFSGASFYYAPSSLLVGEFRLLMQNLIFGQVSPDQLALPMVQDFLNSPYFADYRNAPMGSPEKEAALRKLVGFIAASDISYLAPYLPLSMQNWSSFQNEMNRPSYPGAVAFFHGTQDKTVPFTESVIAKTAMDEVFKNIFGAQELGDAYVASVPALGSQMYTFQPDIKYFNSACSLMSAPASNNKCFDEGRHSDHGLDSAFFTSHLSNPDMISMEFGSENLVNEMLYGANAGAYSTGSVSEQLENFNAAFKDYSPEHSTPFVFGKDVCEKKANGSCYVYAGQITKANLPLYNRVIPQDSIPDADFTYTGLWNEKAQGSKLTPTDVLTQWLNTVAADVLTDKASQ